MWHLTPPGLSSIFEKEAVLQKLSNEKPFQFVFKPLTHSQGRLEAMPTFPIHTIESAPQASKPFLERAKANNGFISNLSATMAESPALLEAYVSVAKIFKTTELSETERQVILMTNNRLNGCEYCMSAHSVIALGAGVPADVVESLRKNLPIADAKLEALRKFSVVVNTSRGWPTPGDLSALLAAGYSEKTVLEVILGTALKLMSNYTNHVAQTPLDAPFTAQVWTAEANGQVHRH